jgi:putative nucleotidyltransferase with HDIG domain
METKEIGKKILEDPVLSKLSNLSKEKNIPIFLVGGYIRDIFLRVHRQDYDFTLPKEASSFIPMIEEILHLHFFKIGKEETNTVTYRIVKKDMSIDLTLFQGKTIEEDLQRRDFTINAIAFSLRDETFHRVEKALEDIENRTIRTVSNHSIDQDPLRMLRAIRYLCILDGFMMDKDLREEIFLKKEKITEIPGERIKMELDKILLSPWPEVGMRTLYELGLLFILVPELKNLENLGQNVYHHLNVLSHTLLMIEKVKWTLEWIAQRGMNIFLSQEDRLSLYYAALFHDIGKQDTYSIDEKGRIHFYHHEAFSCQRAEEILKRLKFSKTMENRILHLIKHHMRVLNLSQVTKEPALKRLVNQMGEGTPLLVVLSLADKEASRGILSMQMDEVVENHCLRVLELFKEKEIVRPSPLITGYDVMALGYSSGPKVGQILKFIREKQVEGDITNREEALKVLKEILRAEGIKELKD